MKKFVAIFIAVISAFGVFAFTACGGNNGVSDGTLEKIKNSTSDKVTLAEWAEAMTSSDIYNSTAVVKYEFNSTYTLAGSISASTVTGTAELHNNLTYENGYVTGNEYVFVEMSLYGYNNNIEEYLIIDETSLTEYTGYGDENYTVSIETDEEGYTMTDTAMDGFYMHTEYSRGEFADCAYSDFTYNDELGSYEYEYTSGDYTYYYELKFSNGNFTYCKLYSYYCSNSGSFTSESTETMEYYYSYDDVSVTIPSNVQSRIDSYAK